MKKYDKISKIAIEIANDKFCLTGIFIFTGFTILFLINKNIQSNIYFAICCIYIILVSYILLNMCLKTMRIISKCIIYSHYTYIDEPYICFENDSNPIKINIKQLHFKRTKENVNICDYCFIYENNRYYLNYTILDNDGYIKFKRKLSNEDIINLLK